MALDEKKVLKPFKKLRKMLATLDRQPTPEQVHDLRTSSRRIEATLQAVPPAFGKNERRMLRQAAKVRRQAGKVRDMDVLTGYAKTLDSYGEQDCIVQLIEHLGTKRHQHAAKLRRLVKRRRARLRQALRKSNKTLRKILTQANDGKSQELSRDAAATVLQLSAELRQPPRLNKTNLHPYRLKVKQLRYVLQNTHPEPDQALIKVLGEVKDAIGEWHDWEELIAIAEKSLDNRHAGCKLVRALRAISHRKFVRALSSAERMRKEYFPAVRRADKRTPSQSFPKPILVATGRVAA
jgi:CHAD domain-containing protein